MLALGDVRDSPRICAHNLLHESFTADCLASPDSSLASPVSGLDRCMLFLPPLAMACGPSSRLLPQKACFSEDHQKAQTCLSFSLIAARRRFFLFFSDLQNAQFCSSSSPMAEACLVPQVEGLVMDSTEALAYLGQIGERTSLRHAVQLLTPGAMMAKTSGRDKISTGDVEQVAELFHDAKFTAKLLAEQADKYVQ